MFLYTVFAVIAGIVGGILLAIRTKKSENIHYGKLDKAGRVTNIVLLPVYLIFLPFCMFLGFLSSPAYEGFLGIIGWIVSMIIASAPSVCWLGLGFSVALRKQGKSKLSFAVQFAGFLGVGLTFLLFAVFYGNLLSSLN